MSKPARGGGDFGLLPRHVTRYDDKVDKVVPTFGSDPVSPESRLFPLAAGAGGRAGLNPCICPVSVTDGARRGQELLHIMSPARHHC